MLATFLLFKLCSVWFITTCIEANTDRKCLSGQTPRYHLEQRMKCKKIPHYQISENNWGHALGNYKHLYSQLTQTTNAQFRLVFEALRKNTSRKIEKERGEEGGSEGRRKGDKKRKGK